MIQLLWKEWHEQSWKLGFGCLVLGAMALIGLHTRIIADQNMMMWVCCLGMTLLPILSSTGLLPAERAEGSFETFVAMPIRPWKILAAKTAMGLLLCAGPLFISGIISLAAGHLEMFVSAILELYLRSILAGASLFLWMLILTSRLPTEARAGLVAVGILIIWLLASAALSVPPVPPVVFAISPFCFVFGLVTGLNDSLSMLDIVGLQLIVFAPLWIFTAKSFKNPVDANA